MKLDLDLDLERRALVERVAELARERLAPRAAHYDRTASFSAAVFADLYAPACAPALRSTRGPAWAPPRDAFTLWMMTKELAKADLSLARCWEGHANSLVLLDALADDEQKARWFPGVVERGDKWVAWSGEPQAPAPGEAARFGTRVEIVPGGYVVDGTKVFATSAAPRSGDPAGQRGGSAARATPLPRRRPCRCSPAIADPASRWIAAGGTRSACAPREPPACFTPLIPESQRIGEPGQ
jgi:alkylation response protein AidB-like acyl-CoA dehydrogenase